MVFISILPYWEKEIISFLFNMVIFLTLLFLPKGSLAQSGDSHENTISSVDGNSLENEESCPVELSLSAPSPLAQPQENPIILKQSGNTKAQEGIGDAFSQDHRDRFQSKNEPSNKVESIKEKASEQK
jgi:hypothetical protein